MTSSTPDPWAETSYDGAERRLRRAVAAATPERRFAWLQEALELALASGALARARRLRQEERDRAWNVPRS